MNKPYYNLVSEKNLSLREAERIYGVSHQTLSYRLNHLSKDKCYLNKNEETLLDNAITEAQQEGIPYSKQEFLGLFLFVFTHLFRSC